MFKLFYRGCWWVLVLAWLGLLPGLARADTLHVAHLGIEQGLAQSSGRAIAQGPDGYLWLGTEAGLQRYDGYRFVHYHHTPGRADSLAANIIDAIAVAPDRSVWVATHGGGLDRLKPDRSGFEHFKHDPDDPTSLASNQVYAVALDRDGRVWVGTDKGVDRLLPDGSFRHYGVGDNPGPHTGVIAITQDSAGKMWFGSAAGLLYLDVASDQLRPFHPAVDSDTDARKAFAKALVANVMQARDGHLWVGTTQGVFVLDLVSGRIMTWLHHRPDDPSSLASNNVYGLLEDANGTVWVGTYGQGLERLQRQDKGWRVTHIRHHRARPDGLSDDTITTLFADQTGLVWIGTYRGGFDIYNPRSVAFSFLQHHPDDPGSLPGSPVWAVTKDTTGQLWVGTGTGLMRFAHGQGPGQWHVFPAPDSGKPMIVTALYADPDGTLWVGTQAGLYRKPAGHKKFAPVALDPPGDGKMATYVARIRPDRQGHLWVVTLPALYRLDPASGKIQRRFVASAQAGSLPDTPLSTLCQTRDGGLWVGTAKGLWRLDGGTGRFLSAPVAAGQTDVLAQSHVMACLAAADGGLWIGTDDGLVHYQPATGAQRVLRRADGLPGLTVYSLVQGLDGTLWLGTNHGLAHVDAHGQIHTWGREDGLLNEEFNQGAAYAAADGMLYFGGGRSLTKVAPEQLSNAAPRARVAITGYTLSGRTARQSGTRAPAMLKVGHELKTLTFQLAVLDYAAPRDNRFLYRLEGFDEGWHLLRDMHSVTYTNLSPGRYTLRVQGMDSHGQASRNQATLVIDVQPPPWLTVWALFGYVVAGMVVLVLGLYLFAVLVRRRRDLTREQQARLWAEALHELLHDLSTHEQEKDIAAQLVQDLPALLRHDRAAFFAASGETVELLATRGWADEELDALRQWPRQQRELLALVHVQARPADLVHMGLVMPAAPADAQRLALPLVATGGRRYLLLIDRRGAPLRPAQMDSLAALARQVGMVLERAALIRRLKAMASTDSLTGVSNRRAFLRRAERELQRALRRQRPLALLMFDVDHFKGVNDSHGHAAGDTVLASLVARCRSQLRAADCIGRYGGEEFAVCLPETDANQAKVLAERLCTAVGEGRISTQAGPLRVTISIGVASFVPGPKDSLSALLGRADKALYVAKGRGRNQVAMATDQAD